jgi:hypothetical protein
MKYIGLRVITPDSVAASVSLSRAVRGLSGCILRAQEALDEDYSRRVEEFAAGLKFAAGAGFEALARELAPAPVVIPEVEVDCKFVFARSTEREFSVRVLNSSWVSRFQTQSSQQQTIRFQVRRAPCLAPVNAGSPI